MDFSMDDQLWVEPVGEIIVVRVRGIPSEALLRECQERAMALTGGYDAWVSAGKAIDKGFKD